MRRTFGYEKKKPPMAALTNMRVGVIMNAASQIKGGTEMIRYVIAV